MVAWLRLYPHAQRRLVFDSANSGKRCGHLQAFAAEHRSWGHAQWVLFTHPDVYLLPRALSMLEAFLSGRPYAAFFVSPLVDRRLAHRPASLYATALFLVRPQRIRQAISSQTSSSTASGDQIDATKDEGGNDALRDLFNSMCLSSQNATADYPGHSAIDLSPERGMYRMVRSLGGTGVSAGKAAGSASDNSRTHRHTQLEHRELWCEIYTSHMYARGVNSEGVWHHHRNEWVLKLVRLLSAVPPLAKNHSQRVLAAMEVTINATRPPTDRGAAARPAGALLHAAANAIPLEEWRRFIARPNASSALGAGSTGKAVERESVAHAVWDADARNSSSLAPLVQSSICGG